MCAEKILTESHPGNGYVDYRKLFLAEKGVNLSDANQMEHSNGPVDSPLANLLEVDSPLARKRNYLVKRGFDILASSIAIASLFPWMIPLVAIVIKLDSRGPVFFRQKRNKKNGSVFSCVKFRTMVENESADVRSCFPNDERITRIGKYLRRYHLDELPQLFHVFVGEMSLIGPRPLMIIENQVFEHAISEYPHRHDVKPGITGLAQSQGKFGSTTDLKEMKERVFLDLYYIKNWSLGMDIKIVVNTLRAMTFRRPKPAR